MTIETALADGDLVAIRVHTEGTNLGWLNGVLPASGRRFAARQSHWFRLRDGMIVEHWAVRHDLTSMLQLGVVARPRLAALLRQLAYATRHHPRPLLRADALGSPDPANVSARPPDGKSEPA